MSFVREKNVKKKKALLLEIIFKRYFISINRIYF